MHQRASTEICPAEPASSFQPATWSDPVRNTRHPGGTTPHTLPGHLCVPAMRRAVRIENDKAIGDRRMAPHHRLHGRRRDPALRSGQMKVCGCIHYTRWAVAVGDCSNDARSSPTRPVPGRAADRERGRVHRRTGAISLSGAGGPAAQAAGLSQWSDRPNSDVARTSASDFSK